MLGAGHEALFGEEVPMQAIHAKARSTASIRAQIACSAEPTGVLARRDGVSMETIRKWRKRGPADCQDRSGRAQKLQGEWGRAVHCVCAASRNRLSAR